MDKVVLEQAVAITSHIMHSFYCDRNIDETVFYFAEDVIWIGPGEAEMISSKDAVLAYFKKGQDKIPACEIADESFRFQDYGEYCLVYGNFIVHTKEESQFVVEANQRVSFFFHYTDSLLWVKHMHVSNPYMEMLGEEFFPREVGAQSYQYLQRLLREKTEVIEMIADNITGGLKSTDDDEIYSHLYVNSGLPKMLGYTYDEFMEKSNYCAIGTVYPPDLPKTLQSVTKQLEQNAVYSVEYRMEKKDGSLIWILDSGRKSMTDQGKYKINSIMMDITPLKTALFELELERSRYRIALQNITDIMFEYDIANDIYITYQRIEVDENIELEKYEMPDFSQSFWAKSIVHPRDTDKFLDLLRAYSREMIEIRTRSVQAKGEWRWTQVSCSVIYNANHCPIRTVGTMKDITDAKNNAEDLINRANQDPLTKLFNQMTAMTQIQQHLEQKNPQSSSALLLVDLDDFRKVNDSMGSLFGNDVLIATSKVLKDNIRADDIVGRISGDEFIIFLKCANREAAKNCSQRILEKVSRIGKKENVDISCSIGIAMTTVEGEDYDELVKRADRAIYFAKANNKNRFIFYEETRDMNLEITD